MRAGMSENRLTSLALMHIHYDHEVNLDTVVDLFAELQPRRLQLRSVLFEASQLIVTFSFISISVFFVISYLQYYKNLETKVYPKCIKIALRRSKVPKIFWGACPQTPLEGCGLCPQ